MSAKYDVSYSYEPGALTRDRDLLALAAKAAGKTRAEWDYDWHVANNTEVARDMLWDPRRDSGQALELLVKLRQNILFNGNRYHVGPDRFVMDICCEGGIEAVRWSIFQAAVEIGRAMP